MARVKALPVLLAAALLLVPTPAAPAQTGCAFVLGFAALRTMIGAQTVGTCLANERFNAANGNSEQPTTGGLLVWRKAGTRTAFTDGCRTWVNGPLAAAGAAGAPCGGQ